jgi:hypothetical protein
MKLASDGGPSVGPTARELGARPDYDIPLDESEHVSPGTGGMSVSPGSVLALPPHRRPVEHGGIGPDPVWKLNSDALSENLRYRPDGEQPTRHGTIEPAERMSLTEFQEALETTRNKWTLVEAP